MRFALLGLMLGLSLQACVRQRSPEGPVRAKVVKPDPFAYEDAPIDAVVEGQDSSDSPFTTARVRFDAYDQADPKNLEVSLLLRTPRKPSRGLVIVLPILGGDYGPSEAFAISLAEAGFTTMRFDRKKDIFDPERGFDHVARLMRNGVIDVRRGLDWAEEARIDGADRVGVLGISMGSFVGTLAFASDPRFIAAVLALGGGGFDEILRAARSEDEIQAVFAAHEAKGLSQAQISALIEEHLGPLDPLHFAPALRGAGSLMVHARFDSVVPYSAGTALWEAAGRPKRIVLLTGHYTAALFLGYLQSLSAQHFGAFLAPGKALYRG